MMTDQEVLFEAHSGTGWVILNRPKALNALSLQMVTAIYNQLKEWAVDESISLICIKSQIEKAFCSGGDVRSICELVKEDPSTLVPKEYFTTEYQMDLLIHEFPKPVLVFMDGIVMGGGVGLSAGSSFRIMTERTKWAMPEMNIGFFPDVGANYFLNQMPGKIGLYLALTAKVITKGDILFTNMANYYLQSDKWAHVEEFIKMNEWRKETAENQLTDYLETICEKTDSLSHELNEEKINYHFQFETMEEIMDSLNEKAEIGDEWAKETRNTLLTKSPTSLKVTLELVKKGKVKTLKESFEMDLEVALNLIHTHDFSEGIRAVLIDKDHSPMWKPDSLNGISDGDVRQFFHYDWKDGRNPLCSINDVSG